jgi:putative membrane protein
MLHDEDEDVDLGGRVDPDSRARTHLANERTFLAWFRTGLTLVALGLATAQFLTRDLVTGVPLRRGIAIGFVAAGLIVTLNGYHRYFRGSREISQASFKPATSSIVLTTAIMVGVGIVAMGFIVLLR